MKKNPTITEKRKSLTQKQVKAIKEEAHQAELVELEAQEQRELLLSAYFVAQSENLPVADSLLNDDIKEYSIDQKIRKVLDEQLEKKEITQEAHDRMIKNLEESYSLFEPLDELDEWEEEYSFYSLDN